MLERKFARGLLCALLIAATLLSGCSKSGKTYAESTIGFLDNVQKSGDSYVLLWQDKPTSYKRMTSLVNVLAPSWLYVNASEDDSGAELQDISQMGYDVDYSTFVQKANADNIEVWASVTSADANLSNDIVTDETDFAAFTDKLVEFVSDSGVNGLILDFENMDPEKKSDFTAFVQQVAEALPEDVKLSVCVTFISAGDTSDDWTQCYDHKKLAEVCDYLIVKAYEQYGLTSTTEGPLCGYEWLYANILKLLALVPSDQMILLLPFYGRDYRFSADTGELWTDDETQAPVVSYAQVEELYEQTQYYDSNQELTTSADAALSETWDKNYLTPYVKFTDTSGVIHVVWYENEESIYQKSLLAVEYGFAGVGAYSDAYSDTKLWKGVRTAVDSTYLSEEMLDMLRGNITSMTVYDPSDDVNYEADGTAIDRLLTLLSICRTGDSAGIDTGYVLKGVVGGDGKKDAGQKIRWKVKEKNGNYLLVPDNEYTSIVTSGHSLWLPEGFTTDMLEGICLIQQASESDDASAQSAQTTQTDSEAAETATQSPAATQTEAKETETTQTPDASETEDGGA